MQRGKNIQRKLVRFLWNSFFSGKLLRLGHKYFNLQSTFNAHFTSCSNSGLQNMGTIQLLSITCKSKKSKLYLKNKKGLIEIPPYFYTLSVFFKSFSCLRSSLPCVQKTSFKHIITLLITLLLIFRYLNSLIINNLIYYPNKQQIHFWRKQHIVTY